MINNINQKMSQLSEKLEPGIKYSYINDRSVFVQRRLSVLSNNLLVGLMLVVVFLSAVLPWRVAAVTAFGIPFSFLAAIGIFYGFEISINLISMVGLIIVVGMLVDDAIVVTENIQRYREEGMPSFQAAITGAQQIWAPVTVSVLTTIMAFTPLMFMSGIFGKFVKEIPLGVIIALAISLWECFFILPHHVAKWVGQRKKVANGGIFARAWDRLLLPPYLWVLAKVIKLRWLTFVGSIAFVVGSFYYAFGLKKVDIVLFPKGAIEIFNIEFEAPQGTALIKTLEAIRPIEAALDQLAENELKDYTTQVGLIQQNLGDPSTKRGSEYGVITVYLTPEEVRQRSTDGIVEDLRQSLGTPQGLKSLRFKQVRGGPPVGKPVNIGVRGKEYHHIMALVKKIEEKLATINGISDIENTYLIGKKEIHITLNDNEAAAAGLSLRDIGLAVRAAFEGIVATSIKKLDEEIDVRVLFAEKSRSNTGSLEMIEVPNNRGNLIPLGHITQTTTTRGISNYQHENNRRQINIIAEIDEKTTNSKRVNDEMRQYIQSIISSHPEIEVVYGGEDEDTKESIQSLIRAFTFAFFGILLILILLFKNIYQPLIIAMTIPLGIVSVLWAFYLHDTPISFLGMIGTIALSGVIVNNAIVFVDFFNRLQTQTSDWRHNITITGKIRLRPIFLTTITTVSGILPTAYGVGGEDKFVIPIALALGWGMLFGAFLTTIILPGILAISEDFKYLFRKMFGHG